MRPAMTADLTHCGSLLDALPDPALLVGPDRRILLANPAARELFSAPLVGSSALSYIRQPEPAAALEKGLAALSEPPTASAPVEARMIQTTPTRETVLRVTVAPVVATGGLAAVLVTLRDISQVEHAEEQRRDFVANVSHEMRSPLTVLAGFIETLKGHAKEDPKARDKFLDIMAAQTQRMSRLVSDLLSLSRIELNEHIPPSGRVDLKLAAGDVIDAISLLARDAEVELKLTAEPGDTHVVADRDEVVQVIQNLVDNAIKYSPHGQTVDILVRPDLSLNEVAEAWSGVTRGEARTRLPLAMPARDPKARYVAVAVRDHGPGLAREHLPRLSERFYRVEGQKSGDRAGTGLGLAIVKHIVNRHRGGLTVESEPGQGTTFVAYFPMANTRAAPGPDV